MTVSARAVIKGEVPPVPVVFTTEALSLWGGFDPDTGTVTDTHHPLCGTRLAGSIFVLPAGRGSSTSSAILLEAVRQQTAPAAFAFRRLDPVFAVGSLVAEKLYGRPVPMLVVDDDQTFASLSGAARASITAEGCLVVHAHA
ncbi:MAG: aconitase X swivel domain-containing protein [Clostridia bacterium]